jgi:hypothetical protein
MFTGTANVQMVVVGQSLGTQVLDSNTLILRVKMLYN